nr:MAG TPA: hypothetical protein [Caudoviricetes sp.]
MKSRLVKLADNTKAIEQFIKTTAQDGRDILKSLEEFKFKIEQCTNVSVNEDINDKIHQHYDMVDKLMSGLFTICYDLENINLVPQYDNDQINLSDQDSPDSDNNGYNLNKEIPKETDEDDEELFDIDESFDDEENSDDDNEETTENVETTEEDNTENENE